MHRYLNFLLSPYLGFSKNTWKIILAGLINSTGLTLTLYISLYLNHLNHSITEIGSVITLLGVGSLAGGYLGGYLTDRFSALNICKASLLLSATLLIIFPISINLNYIRITVLILGLSNNLFRPAFILALSNGEKTEDIQRIVALRRVAINLGMACGAAMLSFLVTQGYHFVFWANAFASLVAYACIRGITEADPKKNIADSNNTESKSHINFYLILLLMFAILLVFNQNQIIYPIYLKDKVHLSMHLISLLFTINGLMIAFMQMPITGALSKYNSNIICAIGALLIGFGFSILSIFTPSTIVIFSSCMLWSMGEIIFFPAILSVILLLSKNNRGKNIGLYQFTFSLALLVSPIFGTLIYAHDNKLLWQISGIIGLLTCFSFLLNTKSSKFITLTLSQNKDGT